MNAKLADRIATGVIIAVSAFIVLLLAGLLAYILFRGIGHISFHFLTSAPQTIKAGRRYWTAAVQLHLFINLNLDNYDSARYRSRDLYE